MKHTLKAILIYGLIFFAAACESSSNSPALDQVQKSLTPTGGSPETHMPEEGKPLVMEQAPSTRTPEQSGSNSSAPQVDLTIYKDHWNVYRNQQYGFSFEYPAVYDVDACGFAFSENESDSIIYFGHSSSITIAPDVEVSLEEYVDGVIRDFSSDASFQLDLREDKSINGMPAIAIDYRFGGLGRFGTATFLKENGALFAFNMTAPANCDIPELQLTERAVYQHVMDTFMISK